MFRVILCTLVLLAGQSSLVTAAEDNFNTTAFKDGATNGSTNANCSAAISWWCQAQLAESSVEPVPGPALNVATGIILLIAGCYACRRR